MRPPLKLPERPSALGDVTSRRHWGRTTPPTNRADMFSATVAAPQAIAGEGEPAAGGGSIATLRMYGPIDSWGGFWGISAKDVSAALDELGDDVTEIRVRINSPGGEAWEGLTILNMLRAHKATVVAVVDGLAASAASFIAAGCDVTVMSPGTQMMIHDASSFAWGNAAEMRKAAEALDSVSNSLAFVYAESAGGTDAQWRAAMVEETWYTAQEAVTAGLADRVGVVKDEGGTATAGADDTSQSDPGDAFEDRFDLSLFNYAGRVNAPGPKLPVASASGSTPPAGVTASGDTTPEGDAAMEFSAEQLTTMRQEIGVAADADGDTIVAGLVEALKEKAEPTTAKVAPEGMVMLDEATLATLKADAAAGQEARSEQIRTKREGLVKAAVNDGRIPPARREHWAALLEADPGAEETLAALTPGLVPLVELGHAEGAAGSEEETAYSAVYPTEKKKEA